MPLNFTFNLENRNRIVITNKIKKLDMCAVRITNVF